MALLQVQELIDSGVHFGHRTSHWNPKMRPYIYGKRNHIHIIDLRETVRGLLRAYKFLAKVASRGSLVVFVGTKRQAKEAIEREATRCDMPYVSERWLGGMLTNYRTIRERLKRLTALEAMWLPFSEKSDKVNLTNYMKTMINETGRLDLRKAPDSALIRTYSKKMVSALIREWTKINRNLQGVREMNRLPDAMVIVDPHREDIAVKEAQRMGVTTVALIDTDSDPDVVDLPIPGNDDSIRSIELILSKLADAVIEGNPARKADPQPARAREPVKVATINVGGQTYGQSALHGSEFRKITVATKLDSYIVHVIAALPENKGIESVESIASKVPMLIKLKDPDLWQPPLGFYTQSRVGRIVSGSGTQEAIRALEQDHNVLGIEASRPAGMLECTHSVPFIRATKVHGLQPSEKGDAALIGFIDTGIDVCHEAFQDGNGNSRIVEIWDQRDSTGPNPTSIHPTLTLNYGSIHTAADIQSYVAASAVPARLKRDPRQHGTHVASIAAGRACGAFYGGVAPEAKIVLVIADLKVGPSDPVSIGYSRSHVEALAYIKEVARELQRPVVVNVSLGMNAGAHDGTSYLETAFDDFSRGGREPGLIIVKSAGNERTTDGHAKLSIGSMSADSLRWTSSETPRRQDLIELWFNVSGEMKFRLRNPSHEVSAQCSWAKLNVTGTFTSGNAFALRLSPYHDDNGDSRLLVVIEPGSATNIASGPWELDIEAGQVLSKGVIHAWVERLDSRPVRFTNHQDEEITLSIPGTARSVITVAAVNSAVPIRNTDTSSYGLTRDDREKPDVVAPGTDIEAAQAGTTNGVRTMTGTSMAAPHVTGAVALLLSRKAKEPGAPIPNAAQVRAALCKRAQFFTGHHTPSTGYGLIDAEGLLKAFP